MKRKRIDDDKCFFNLAWLLMVIVGLLASTGCATIQDLQSMPLRTGMNSLHLDNGSVCLLSIKAENQFKPGWPPEVYRVTVINDDTKKRYLFKVVELDSSLFIQTTKDMFTANKEGPTEALVSFQLMPGTYRLKGVGGGCTKALTSGHFDFPFDIPFTVNPGEYVYMGRIEMTNRERVSKDEIPSGGKFPLLDQSISGFGRSTFDVNVIDNFDQDIDAFKAKFPVIANQEIRKRILPQWKKPVGK